MSRSVSCFVSYIMLNITCQHIHCMKHPAHLPVQIKVARDIDDNVIVIYVNCDAMIIMMFCPVDEL